MGMSVTLTVIVALALLVSWLGGGRKWAFRTMLSLLILALLGGSGVVLYAYWTGKSAERRAERLHECTIANFYANLSSPSPISCVVRLPSSFLTLLRHAVWVQLPDPSSFA
jgi:hypothetical protein